MPTSKCFEFNYKFRWESEYNYSITTYLNSVKTSRKKVIYFACINKTLIPDPFPANDVPGQLFLS